MILNDKQLAQIARANKERYDLLGFPGITDIFNPKAQIIDWLLETIISLKKEIKGENK